MLKELERVIAAGMPSTQPKWRNIYFAKDGHSHIGNRLLDSIDEAKSIAATVEALIEQHRANGTVAEFITMKPPLLSSEYVWHMQLPAMDGQHD